MTQLKMRVYFVDGPFRGQWQWLDQDTGRVQCIDQRGVIPVAVYEIKGNTASLRRG